MCQVLEVNFDRFYDFDKKIMSLGSLLLLTAVSFVILVVVVVKVIVTVVLVLLPYPL